MNETLIKLAKHLGQEKITWGIGGSMLLKKCGFACNPNDLDILISKKDIHNTVLIMDALAERMQVRYKEEYMTDFFYTYKLDNTYIDVLAGFKIKHEYGVFEVLFDELSIDHIDDMHGIQIPYSSPEDWFIAYSLMKGREEKVEFLRNLFNEHGISHSEIFIRALKQRLPLELESELKSYIF